MNRYGCKGTITVFLSLISTLFLSLLCTLTESARVQGAESVASSALDMGIFSVMGEYEREMLDRFNVFFLDGAYGTGEFDIRKVQMRLKNMMEYTTEPDKGLFMSFSMNLFPMDIGQCTIDKYALATDGNGGVFYAQAVANQKAGLAADVINKVLDSQSKAEQQDKASQEYEQSDREIGKRMDELEAEKEAVEESERQAALEDKKGQQDGAFIPIEEADKVQVDNPLDEIKKIKKLGLLGLVLKDPSKVSGKTVDKKEMVSHREIEKGNMQLEGIKRDLISDGIFQEYLLDSFPNITKKGKEGSLDYQLEYILVGKDNDVDNLKSVVNRLLLMREGANFAYAMGNSAMREAALALAILLVGAIPVPGLVTATKAALLLAWAYGESLIDVRILLAGGKVPLLKDESSWRLSLENLAHLTQILEEADSSTGKGLAYKDYLRMLLVVGDKEGYPMRALDMIEGQMRKRAATAAFHADYCIAGIRAEAEFYINPVFIRIPSVFIGTYGGATEYGTAGAMTYLAGG